MATKRLVAFALALVMLGLAGYVYLDYQYSQPCYGFTREEMPAPVARYVCQYEDVQAQMIGAGPGYTVLMLSSGEEVIGMSVHTDQDDGTIGNIIYFRDKDGNVLIDRRNEQPAEMGQDG